MKIHNVDQNTKEWDALHIGIPSASSFEKIITPKGKPSSQAIDYINTLLSEIILNKRTETKKSFWMERGHALEQEAVNYYEFQKGLTVEKVGFVTNDEITVGASPDRLVGNEGLLEIKCPAPNTQIGYILAELGDSDNVIIDDDYRIQLQGQLLITGRHWVDILAYHPDLSQSIIRVNRDMDFLVMLTAALAKFQTKFAEKKRLLQDHGVYDFTPKEDITRLTSAG